MLLVRCPAVVNYFGAKVVPWLPGCPGSTSRGWSIQLLQLRGSRDIRAFYKLHLRLYSQRPSTSGEAHQSCQSCRLEHQHASCIAACSLQPAACLTSKIWA